MARIRIALAQINTTVGGITGNTERILAGIDQAISAQADIVVFPEMAVTGYPAEDLLYKSRFLEDAAAALETIARHTAGKDILAVVGTVRMEGDITNAAAVIENGGVVDMYDKIYLPNYGVFDEYRYFTSGKTIPVYIYKGVRIGLNICEDIWYPGGPLHYQALAGGAELVINISASPFHAGKQEYRETMYRTRAGDESVILVNCNLAGGQDELVFDGSSTVTDENGRLLGRMKAFTEDFAVFDLDTAGVHRKRLKDIRGRHEKNELAVPFEMTVMDLGGRPRNKQGARLCRIEPTMGPVESIYRALVLGTADYVNKNGFEKVIVAVSGGVDSALVLAVACDALGKDRVKGLYLPSQFSASISGEDAEALCQNLGVELFRLPIEGLFSQYRDLLKPVFKDLPFNTAEENLQSRIRGNIVMAFSNKFNWLVLTTGNKSEMSTGYATLYGDMAGGFAVIKDVLKTVVYDLCQYRNALGAVIPERIITRPPSAELRPDQKDTDSLPEYAVLDRIIRAYVEEDRSVSEIAREIGDEELVKRVARLIDINEYKRRQAPPGVKITPRAFGKDRRMPITSGYRG